LSHWTERSIDDYAYYILADFLDQLDIDLSNDEDDSAGYILLSTIIKRAQDKGKHVALIAYDKTPVPIVSDIFYRCWERAGKPEDYFALGEDL